MHYETANAVKNIRNDSNGGSLQNILRFIDLNHCSASEKNPIVILKEVRNQIKRKLPKNEKEKFIVFDCTSE